MLKLDDLDTTKLANEGVWIQIVHPVTKADTGVEVRVLGMDSDAYKRIVHKQQNARARRVEKGQGLRMSAEEVEAERLDLLVACTVEWKGVSRDGNIALDCTASNVREVYQAIPIIREQVDAAIADRGNFMPA